MDTAEIQKQKQEIINQYGQWTAHSIELAPNLFTVEGKENSSGRPAHYVTVIQDFLTEPLHKLRILDLGSLEGLFSFEFARQGSEVIGIEGRLANIEKARFANRILGFDKCQFIQDDVRNVSADKYGRFDVVFCCGILYHLDAPDVFIFLEKMADVCKRILLVDTQVAAEKTSWKLQAKTEYEYKGQKYSGRRFKEQLESPWAALNNPYSYWLYRESLYRAIRDAGFLSIYEDPVPYLLSENNDRLTFVCLK